MSLLPETLNDPVLIAAVTLLVAAAVHYQKGLTFREYREIMRVKRRVFPLLDRLEPFAFGSFVHAKQAPEDDAEYLTTLDVDARTLWSLFVDGGWSPHLVSSLKQRPDGSLSLYHFVWYHDDGTQTEVYTFRATDGWDVYAHHETTTVDVEGHLSDSVTDADPRGVVTETLAQADA